MPRSVRPMQAVAAAAMPNNDARLYTTFFVLTGKTPAGVCVCNRRELHSSRLTHSAMRALARPQRLFIFASSLTTTTSLLWPVSASSSA